MQGAEVLHVGRGNAAAEPHGARRTTGDGCVAGGAA